MECPFDYAAVIFNLIGVAIGGLIGYFSARKISNLNARSEACADLRSAFAPALAFIYIARNHGDHDRPNIDQEIKASLFEHGAAIEKFRPFVKKTEADAYQTAWEKYRSNAAKCPFAMAGEEWNWGSEEGEIIEASINAILEFAKT